jgi:membrane protease YdiL (CAAX protease family)
VALWTVIAFPALQALVYVVLFVAAKMAWGLAGITRMSRLAPHLFPLVLALPLAVVAWSDPSLWRLWLQTPSLLWVVIGIATGVALFYGESGFNQWRRTRAAGSRAAGSRPAGSRAGSMDGFVFSPLLFPFQSLLIVVMEETIWRGFLFAAMMQRFHWSVPLAVVGSAVLFSLHHAYFGAATAAFKGLSATAYSVLFLAGGSIWVCLAAHFASDLLAWRRLLHIAREQAAYPPTSGSDFAKAP